jgi:Neocarzinostatin family
VRRIKLIGLCVVAALTSAAVVSTSAFGSAFVRVTPHTSLADGQVVTVSAGGFVPGSSVRLAQCTQRLMSPGGADICDNETAHSLTASSKGTIGSISFTVHRGKITGFREACGTTKRNKTCYISASSGMDIANASIVFQYQELIVTPNTKLVGDEEVTVSAKHFLPNMQLRILECNPFVYDFSPSEGLKTCDTQSPTSVMSNGEGIVAPTPFRVFTGAVGEGTWTGACGMSTRTEQCYIELSDEAGNTLDFALATLTFVP